MGQIVFPVGFCLGPGGGDGRTGTDGSAMAEFIKGMGAIFRIGVGIIQAIHQQEQILIFAPQAGNGVGIGGADWIYCVL